MFPVTVIAIEKSKFPLGQVVITSNATYVLDSPAVSFAVWPFLVPVCAVGAPHERYRVWLVAHAAGKGLSNGRGEAMARQTEKPEPWLRRGFALGY